MLPELHHFACPLGMLPVSTGSTERQTCCLHLLHQLDKFNRAVSSATRRHHKSPVGPGNTGFPACRHWGAL